MPDAEAGAQVFSPEECLCNVVSSARRHFSDYPPVVATGSTAKWERLEPENGYFIIGGGLSVKTTCGSDTVELVQMAVDDGFGVLAFGDSAAVLGEAGLIGSKGGTCVIPADNPSGLGWAFAMIRDRCLDKPVLAAFPEASSVKDLASALMMSVLGVPTYFGSVLPIWGPELPAKLGLSSAGGIPLITYPSRVAVGAAWKQMREALSS
jgi:hypothetical protein